MKIDPRALLVLGYHFITIISPTQLLILALLLQSKSSSFRYQMSNSWNFHNPTSLHRLPKPCILLLKYVLPFLLVSWGCTWSSFCFVLFRLYKKQIWLGDHNFFETLGPPQKRSIEVLPIGPLFIIYMCVCVCVEVQVWDKSVVILGTSWETLWELNENPCRTHLEQQNYPSP